MARVELRLPQMGMGMSDAEILEWHVAVGDVPLTGDLLAVIEAD